MSAVSIGSQRLNRQFSGMPILVHVSFKVLDIDFVFKVWPKYRSELSLLGEISMKSIERKGQTQAK